MLAVLRKASKALLAPRGAQPDALTRVWWLPAYGSAVVTVIDVRSRPTPVERVFLVALDKWEFGVHMYGPWADSSA